MNFLESIGNPFYIIALPEITDIPLNEYTASKGKPMILSTGLAEIEDIELAHETCRKDENHQISLLKCTSQYPATIEQANLKTIPDMKKRFGIEIGVSDHTMGSMVPIVAVSLGATIVEKHFILDRKLGGPDSGFSMEPHEFKKMVESIRQTEKAIGVIEYSVSAKDKTRRRSLFVVKDIQIGEKYTEYNVKSIRPGVGMHPKYLKDYIGRTALSNLNKGMPFNKII